MNRRLSYMKLMIPRKRGVAVRITLITLTVMSFVCAWWLADLTSKALLPPRPIEALDHFKLNRSLKSYIDSTQVLIEPSNPACSKGNVPLLVLVTSSPTRFAQRQAIRETWGPRVPTYFVIGLDGTTVDDLLVDNYVEAKKYSDIIVFQFRDHYQNLTLKTALMLHWTLARCPRETMLFKTDDDVLVNPWRLSQLVAQHSDKDLIGYRKMNNYLHRDQYNKWFVPRWLYRQDFVPEYLSGTGYLINGRHLHKILDAAFNVPVINLEDVYFTYIVAKLKLGLTLTHSHRLSPYKPWLSVSCTYWELASAHSLSPNEMLSAWPGIQALGLSFEKGRPQCGYFDWLWSEWLLY